MVLTPASCYPVYPLVASRGPVGETGCLIDASSYCFRHEPSIDPARLQMFRQRELVFIGTPERVADFIELWLDRATSGLRALSLDVHTDNANDAFFGRFREMLVSAQKSQRLKTELLAPISNPQQPSACGSCNHHKNHFSAAFGIRLAGGDLAYTACAGFGLERLAMALIRRHGMVPREWPADLRQRLRLAS
jgi:seryl-tRNA synthetase